ncbi:unnamed protein product [Ixodes pacificus]
MRASGIALFALLAGMACWCSAEDWNEADDGKSLEYMKYDECEDTTDDLDDFDGDTVVHEGGEERGEYKFPCRKVTCNFMCKKTGHKKGHCKKRGRHGKNVCVCQD